MFSTSYLPLQDLLHTIIDLSNLNNSKVSFWVIFRSDQIDASNFILLFEFFIKDIKELEILYLLFTREQLEIIPDMISTQFNHWFVKNDDKSFLLRQVKAVSNKREKRNKILADIKKYREPHIDKCGLPQEYKIISAIKRVIAHL